MLLFNVLLFRLQGDNLVEQAEDVSLMSQGPEKALPDSDGKLHDACKAALVSNYVILIK